MFVHRLVCPVLALLAWLALPSGPAHGQMPKLPGISGPPAGGGSPAAAGAVPSATSLAGELAKTEAKLAHIKVPGGISEDEVTAYRNELRRTVFNLERQIGLIQAAADPPPGDLSAAAAPGQPAGPPFSFLHYDKLRDSRDEEADRLEAMRASVRMLEGLLENQRERLKAATKDSQTAAENLQRNLKQPGEAAALWRVEAAAAAVQAAATGISYLGMRLKAVQPSVEHTTANLQRLESEIAAMADQVVVSAKTWPPRNATPLKSSAAWIWNSPLSPTSATRCWPNASASNSKSRAAARPRRVPNRNNRRTGRRPWLWISPRPRLNCVPPPPAWS